MLLLLVAICSTASAQNSRLFNRPLPIPIRQIQGGPPGVPYGPMIDDSSWITIPLPPPREIRPQDIVTIRVDLTARATQEGDFQRRKNSTLNAQLKDWLVLEGLTQVKPAPQSDGDQTIAGTLNKQDRITAELETSESLKFEIAATVAAVLPNGNVVLEAHRKVNFNEETWMLSLSGVCHKDSIGPGNFVLNKDIAQLDIKKEEIGSVKDSYKRGWLQRGWDLIKAF